MNRAYRICSSWLLFHKEVIRLRTIFLQNSYPASFFDHHLKCFISKVVLAVDRGSNRETTEIDHTLVLPYVGGASDRLQVRLSRLCKRYNLRTRLVFTPFKISRYFSLKTRLPDSLRSNVVYKFHCSEDPKHSYIGKTKRHLITRVREHGSSTQSAVFSHRLNCSCSNDLSSYTVLRSCHTEYDLSISEALFIKSERPNLNSTITNNGQSLFLNLY